jgi:serine/threonine-protein phosphatase PP1 catalytic subunit
MINRLLEVGYSGKIRKSVCLKNAEITTLRMAARDVFLAQRTLIELSPPVKIVGDVHGQYFDLNTPIRDVWRPSFLQLSFFG